MTHELTPTLIAVEVPEDTRDIFPTIDGRILFFTSDARGELVFKSLKCCETEIKILGTVTKDTIGFDCEPYCETHKVKYHEYTPGYKEWTEDAFKTYDDEIYTFDAEKSFRSLLESKGITDYKKLVILEKL